MEHVCCVEATYESICVLEKRLLETCNCENGSGHAQSSSSSDGR